MDIEAIKVLQPPNLRIRVTSNSSQQRVQVVENRSYQVAVFVHAAAEGGKANAAVLALLGTSLGLAETNLKIKTGKKSRDKVLSLVWR